jgi:hypothetical protein
MQWMNKRDACPLAWDSISERRGAHQQRLRIDAIFSSGYPVYLSILRIYKHMTMPSNALRAHWPIALVLTLLSALLYAIQYTTMLKLSVLPPSLSYQSWPRFYAELANRNIGFDTLDKGWLVCLVSLLIALLICEMRGGRISLFLGYIFASSKRSALFFTASSFVLVRYYFAPGEMSWAGDAPQHLSYSFITQQAFSAGEWPIWTNALGAGSPYTQFYGFLFFYMAGALAWITAALYPSLKLLLATCHVLSGLGTYMLISRLCRSRRAGFFAGLSFVLCFWHVQHVLVMGRLPLGLFYALLPWPFFFFERLRSATPPWPHALHAGIALGLLAFTHPGYAFWATTFFALYVVLRLVQGRGQSANTYTASALALISGLVAGSYLTLAMWVERGSTGLHAGFYLRDTPVPTWWHLLVWSNYRFWLVPPPEGDFHWYGGYLGLSIVAAASVACFYVLYTRRYRWLALYIPLAFSLLLVFAHDLPPLNMLPFVQAMPPVRYLLFVVFFLSLCAGIGFHFIEADLRRRGYRRTAVFLFALLLLDLGPTTFQHLYPNSATDPTGYNRTFLSHLAEESQVFTNTNKIPNYRLLWIAGPTPPYVAIGRPQFLTQIPTPHAPHPGDLRSVHEFTSPLEHMFSDTFHSLDTPNALKANPNFPLISAGLRMLNVRYLLATLSDDSVHKLQWKNSPVLASARIAPYRPEQLANAFFNQPSMSAAARRLMPDIPAEKLLNFFRTHWIIENTGVSPHDNTCAQILVYNIAAIEDLNTQAHVEVIDHNVWNSRAEIVVRATAETYVRLAYSYSPHLSVLIDNQRIEALETAGHFIALHLPEGTHHITLKPELSLLRQVLLAAHLAIWLATAVFWITHFRRQKN